MAHHAEEHTVYADRGFNIVRYVALIGFGVKILDLTTAVLLMLREIEVST